ncbi:MAG: hypothetical protein HY270_07420 [Deltaproteobacteria bacterium]|nr:hypothetical protein [Deltaproteobacteria bacterium]
MSATVMGTLSNERVGKTDSTRQGLPIYQRPAWRWAAVAIVATWILGAGHVLAGTKVGDCQAPVDTVGISEVQACVNIFSGTQAVSTCSQCDANGDGTVSINEVQGSVNCFLDAGCPMITALSPTPTHTTPVNTPTFTVPPTTPPTATPTKTLPPIDTATFTATATATNTPVTPSATPTTPPAGGSCGADKMGKCCNMVVDTGEECDDGGTCVGGANGGKDCTKAEDCPDGYCQAFGGDGCAANCTNERSVRFAFTGARCYGATSDTCGGIQTCVGGAYVGKPCSTNSDCGPAANRGVCTSECVKTAGDGSQCFGVGECATGDADKIGKSCPSRIAGNYPPLAQPLCQGGTRVGYPCVAVGAGTPTPAPGCPGGSCVNPCGTNGTCQHRSGSVIQTVGVIPSLSIGPFTGGEDLIMGKAGADGLIPVAVPATSVSFAPVKVQGLACACPAGSADAQVHGPGNSGSGYIACGAGGLVGVDVDVSRDHNTTTGGAANGLGSCKGGTRDGLACGAALDCPGTGATCSGLGSCVGGTNDGKECLLPTDCPSGTCQHHGGGACVAGTNKGKVCHVDADCGTNGTCVSPDDSSCNAQEPPPPTGSGSKACLESKEKCESGPIVGTPCTANAQCNSGGSTGATCGNDCNSGGNHPGTCNGPIRLSISGTRGTGSAIIVTNTAIGVITEANDCSRSSVCTPVTFGLPTTTPPTACSVDAECGAGKACSTAYCAGTCTGGANDGKPCIRTSECPSGTCNQGGTFGQACTGSTAGECPSGGVCVPVSRGKGFDGLPCTDDDPDSSKGVPQNAPTTTGIASTNIIDAAAGTTGTLGHLVGLGTCNGNVNCLTSRKGKEFDCTALMAANPSVTGATLVSAFNQLDPAQLGDDAITINQTAK